LLIRNQVQGKGVKKAPFLISGNSSEYPQEGGPAATTALPNVTVSDLPNVTVSDLPNVTVSDLPNGTVSDLPNVTVSDLPNGTVSDLPNVTVSDLPNVTVSDLSNVAATGTVSPPYRTISSLCRLSLTYRLCSIFGI
jgi:hypothetical protein